MSNRKALLAEVLTLAMPEETRARLVALLQTKSHHPGIHADIQRWLQAGMTRAQTRDRLAQKHGVSVRTCYRLINAQIDQPVEASVS